MYKTIQLIDIINNLIDKDKELFNKAFNIWCNIIYNKDAVYTEELVTVFMIDTIYYNIDSNVYVNKELADYAIKDDANMYLVYLSEIYNRYMLTLYYNDILEEFIKEYGTN